VNPFDGRRARPGDRSDRAGSRPGSRPGSSPGSRPDFGSTWWGRAWVDALERRAELDANRLPRGRTYARQGRVGEIVIAAGTASALVQGSRVQPYSVVIGVRTFSEHEWDEMLGAIAGRALHAAALLDGELVPEILEDGRRAGVDLLPGPGELTPRCSCPDWADPCKHAAAVCYLVARVLDDDPFALLQLRGRDRAEILAGVRARRAGTAGTPTDASAAAAASSTPGATDPPMRAKAVKAARPERIGVSARDAWADGGIAPSPGAIWALPGPAVPRRPGHPTPLAVDPPRESHLAAEALQDLAQDAANRAWQLLRGGSERAGASGLGLSAEQDLARRAAPLLGTSEFTRLARSSGVASHHLVELALAWRLGGAEGIDILTEEWEPDPETIADGRDALMAVVLRNVRVRVRANRITAGPVQLRVAPNGNWYRFEKANNRWELTAGPDVDPLNVAEPRDD
jgi:uncharacterized Zn finger protein